MRRFRKRLRELLPASLRERYHTYALRRDFGIDRRSGSRRAGRIDRSLARGLNLVGYFASQTGVGQSARALADAAELAGVPVARIEAAPGERHDGEGRAPFDVNLYHVNADGADGVVEELGPRLHGGRANVAYWYWESETFPARWRDRFDYFDEVWVATEFCRRAIASVSPLPVVVVPPAVDVAGGAFEPATGEGSKHDFSFLTMADATSVPERKNPLGVVRAFAAAFSPSDRAVLRVQLRNARQVPGLLEELDAAGRGARVSVIDESLSRGEIVRLLAACDAYVSLHRCEGFGFPIAEAMAMGKPVIATDYSGCADYLDQATGFPVRWTYRVLTASIRDYPAGSRWAEPDLEDAAAQLRRAASDPEEGRRRGDAARRRIAGLYGPDVAGGRVAARLATLRERLKASA
jgi:glycosyltransferase involved in cell wall biosynthesis